MPTTITDTSVSRSLTKSNANYTTARDSAAADSVGTTAMSIGQRKPANYDIFRTCLYFDCSSIPNHYIVVGCVLYLYGTSDASTTDFDFVLQINSAGTYPRNPVVVGDFDRTFYAGSSTTTFNTSAFNGANWNAVTLSPAGCRLITTGGITRLILRSSREVSGTAPTGDEYVNVESPTHAGGHDPYLSITTEYKGSQVTRKVSALWPEQFPY